MLSNQFVDGFLASIESSVLSKCTKKLCSSTYNFCLQKLSTVVTAGKLEDYTMKLYHQRAVETVQSV